MNYEDLKEKLDKIKIIDILVLVLALAILVLEVR